MTTTDLEKLQTRRLWLLLIGITLGAFGAAGDEITAMLGKPQPADGIVNGITLGAWGLFIFAAFFIKAGSRGGHCRELLTDVVDDERVRETRNRSYVFGFNVMLMSQVVIMLTGLVLERIGIPNPNMQFVANLNIGIGIAAAVGRFLYLNR
ncbi:MAG: hypothetical protein HKN12_00785 [Gemmatimonadetes bacterium]|nr:hypothetical protein [Gemmatimonadota bacterium]